MNHMEKKRKSDIWDYLLWISIILILGWAFLKATGWINTPEWVLMIPYFAAGLVLLSCVFKAGKISQSIESMDTDVKDLKIKTENIDKNLTSLSTHVALRDEQIKRMDDNIKEYLNPKPKK